MYDHLTSALTDSVTMSISYFCCFATFGCCHPCKLLKIVQSFKVTTPPPPPRPLQTAQHGHSTKDNFLMKIFKFQHKMQNEQEHRCAQPGRKLWRWIPKLWWWIWSLWGWIWSSQSLYPGQWLLHCLSIFPTFLQIKNYSFFFSLFDSITFWIYI